MAVPEEMVDVTRVRSLFCQGDDVSHGEARRVAAEEDAGGVWPTAHRRQWRRRDDASCSEAREGD